ncbi:MAG: GlxA family transcriptional regulator, partial [Burkholderiaceae bacterium]
MSDHSRLAVTQLPKHRFVFLTLPNYTMIALASAVDALRMANRVSKRELYEWTLATLDGAPAMASNGLSMS